MTLRSRVIRLAHANPNLRPHLLPLLKTAEEYSLETILQNNENQDWIAREYGVADVSGNTARERTTDLVYQIAWELSRSKSQHSVDRRLKDLLALAKKRRWHEVLRAYEAGKKDGAE